MFSIDRARWLKESNPEAEELFRMVAEVFIFWAKSHVRNQLPTLDGSPNYLPSVNLSCHGSTCGLIIVLPDHCMCQSVNGTVDLPLLSDDGVKSGATT